MKEEKTPRGGGRIIDEAPAENKIRKEEKTPEQTGSGLNERRRSEPMTADEIVRSAQNALQMEAADEPSAPKNTKPAKKKRKHSFFHRKKDADSVSEDDIYYGLQLKSLKEYQHDYEETIRFDIDRIRRMENEVRRSQEKSSLKPEEPVPAQVEPEKPEKPISAQAEPVKPEKPISAQAEPVKPEEPVSAQAEPVKPEEPVSAQAEPVKPEEPISVQAEPVKPEEPVSAQAEPVKPEEPISAQAEPVKPEEPVSAQAEPVKPEKAAAYDDRQGHLEQIMRSAGLDTEGLFDSAEAPKPEPPVNPPQPTGSPEAKPPIPPTVEPPEPAEEPHRVYPIEEPSPMPVPESTKDSAAVPQTEANEKSTQELNNEPEPPVNLPQPTGSPEAEPPVLPTVEPPEPAEEPHRVYPIEEPSPMPVPESTKDSAAVPQTEANEKPIPEPDNEPEPPVNLPKPAGSPETEPPVLPTVEPEPAKEPQRTYPIQEPSPTPVPEFTEESTKDSAAVSQTEANEKPIPEPDNEPEKSETAAHLPNEKPGMVKEPSAPPHTEKEPSASPARKEPSKRDFPRYRAATLPLQIIELNTLEDTLAAEAAKYELPPIHAPKPIPFPTAAAEQPEEHPEPESPETEAPSSTPILRIPTAPQQPESEEPSEEPPKAEEVPEACEKPKKPKKAGKGKKNRFRLVGTVEDADIPEPQEEPQEELDDYTSPEDAPSVGNDLLASLRKLFLRFAVTGIFALMLIAYSIAWEHAAVLPTVLHTLFTSQNYLVISLIFLALTVLFCLPAIWNGLQGLFRFQANSDSTAAVAALATLAENIVFLFTGLPANCRLYSSLAVLALFLNTAAKLSMEKRILRNFRFLTSSEQKYAVRVFDDYNTALRMAKNCVAGEPKIAYQAKTGFLQNFLKHSYSADDPMEHISQFLAPAGFIGSLVLCIAAAVLTKDAQNALTVFTASTCVCVPFGGLLSVNLPLARLSKISGRCGGMTVGWDAVEQFSETNAVLVDAEDLFPRGTVVLNGIQTFAGQRIDQAILDATALTAAVGGPLNGLFSQIVKTRGEVLPHVERPAYEDGMGISGTVSNRLILVGNGALLKHHGVDAPSHDYEEKYLRAGKIPVYLACGGMLVAMFLVFYRSDRRRAVELRRLEYNGISLLVRTRDPNITPELIAGCFGLSPHSISVLPENLGNVYTDLRTHAPERAPAVLATKGRTGAMMRMITACTRQKGNITLGTALQTAGAVLGFALVALFTFCRGIGQLSATALLLFEGFWTAAAILIPHIRRP